MSISKRVRSTKDDISLFLIKFSEWNKMFALKADENKQVDIPTKGRRLSKEAFFALRGHISHENTRLLMLIQ